MIENKGLGGGGLAQGIEKTGVAGKAVASLERRKQGRALAAAVLRNFFRKSCQ
jgi:hypothetical protein